MEWNAKSSVLWDWESSAIPNPRIAEHGCKLHPTNFQSKREINVLSFSSGGDNKSVWGPVSKLGQTSPMSSKSVSTNSSSIEESRSRTSNFTLEGFDASLEDFGNKKESVEIEAGNTYGTPETLITSCEPMLSLKLGKRAYYEDANAGNGSRPCFSSGQSETTRKRCRSVFQNTLSPCCQVEGCNINLSNVKDYYRKHRVCEGHSKSPKVIIGGIERRFCQQCSRFHSLSEFDEKKRSCRRRLSNHNARRRKPQSRSITLNPAVTSSLDFERPQVGLFADELSHVYNKPNANSKWDATFSSKRSQCSNYVLKHEKTCDMTGQLNISEDEMPYLGYSKFLSFKGASSKVLDTGYVGNTIASNLQAQDLHRALSLLSTDLKGPANPNHTNQTYVSQTAIQALPLPFASVDSECWCNEQPIEPQVPTFYPNNIFQDFQLFKSPFEIEVYSNQLS